jgi:L-asparaginase
MSRIRSHFISLAALVTATSAATALSQAPAPVPVPAQARVVILATGGTIAGVQPKEGEAGYKSGAVSIDSLVKAAPGLEKLAAIKGEQIASIGSQDMNDFVWVKLAKKAAELLASPDVDGIVVTHGTDTLEETAYFLSLVLKSDKPVVLVGSMRPSTELSAEGPSNLYNAMALAADPMARGRGVLVVANDTAHAARFIVKTHTTSVQTFISVGRSPVAEVLKGTKTAYLLPASLTASKGNFSTTGIDAMPRVDIVYAHENGDGTFVKAAVAAGAKGIVLAGVGDGNATKEMIDALTAAAKAGVVVVRSTRVGSGIVRRNIEVNDDQLGFVAGLDLNPQKARVLLRLALMKSADVKKVQQIFEEN